LSLLLGQVLTVLLVAQIGLVIWNVRVVRRPPARRWPVNAPLISVLVPARDEEASIGACVGALLEQDYPNVEIIVLDDGSTDGTAGVARRDPRVNVVPGTPSPHGWTGKNWACHQLAARARGDVLCFVDADTILSPDALSRAAGELQDDDLGLVSLLLRTDTRTVAELVLMPMVNHALLALLPAGLMERSGHPSLAIALGPFIMVRRGAYVAAGGHAAAPGHVVDDVQLARAVKASGHRVGLRNGTALVHTRWYGGFRQIWDGFSKNAYGGLGYRPGVALAALLIVAPALLLPFLRLAVGLSTGGAIVLPAFQVSLILSTRAVTARAGRDPLRSIPFHPVMITVWAGALVRSMLLARTGREIEWKGRKLLTGPPRSPL
jgi:chlorobactene glucosyltransferase